MPVSPERIVGEDLIDIYRKVDEGTRLSFEDGWLHGEHGPRASARKENLLRR